MKKHRFIVALALFLLTLSACGRINGKTDPPHEDVALIQSISAEYNYVDTYGNFLIFQHADGSWRIYNKTDGTERRLDGSADRFGRGIFYSEEICFHIIGETLEEIKIERQPTNNRSSLFPLKKKGDYGFTNIQGSWIIPPRFAYAGEFSEGLAYVECSDAGDYGLLDEDGNVIRLCVQDGDGREQAFSDGYLLLHTFGNRNHPVISTFISKDNTIINTGFQSGFGADYMFLNARAFSEGFAAVEVDGKWGYIASDGTTAVAPKYKEAFSFQDGSAVVVQRDGTLGRIRPSGEEVGAVITLPQGYTYTGGFHDGFYSVKCENGYNLMDQTGAVRLNGDYQYLSYDEPFWFLFSAGDSMAVFLPSAPMPISVMETPKESDFCQGKVRLKTQAGKDEIYDISTGECLFSARKIGHFFEGLASCKGSDGTYGYINPEGEWVIPPQFESCSDFHGGVAYIKSETQCGLLANPLLFPDGWIENTIDRGKLYGIELSGDINGDCTVRDFDQIMEALYQMQSIDRSDAVHTMISARANDHMDLETIVKAFSMYAHDCGQITQRYIYPYQNEVNDTAFRNALAYVSTLGILSDTNGRFEDNVSVSRAEAVSLAVRLLKSLF